MLLETLLVLLAAAAAVTALVLPHALVNAGGLSGDAQAVDLFYPLIDSALLSTAVIGAAVAGRRAGSPWALIALGAAALTVADMLWTMKLADGDSLTAANALYPLWPGLVAAAAYLPAPQRAPHDRPGPAHPRRLADRGGRVQSPS